MSLLPLFTFAFSRITEFFRSFISPILPAHLLLCTLLFITPLHAASSLYIKPDDDVVRATERLHDFLSDIGYAVEFYDEDKDMLIIHQQKHRIRAVILVGENELSSVVLSVHYHLNKKAATPAERAACMNLINASQYGVKACVDEEREDFYLEYILPFDGSLSPRAIKRFADQVVARTYLMVANDKTLNAVIFGADDDSPDTARNADEAEGEPSDEDCDPEEESPSSAAQPPSRSADQPSSASVPPESSSASGRGDATSSSTPSPPESSSTQPPSRSADQPSSPSSSAPTAPTPSSSLVPVSPPSSSAPAAPVPPASTSPEPPSRGAAVPPSSTSPVPPSLETALPPTTPAAPARPKKARA